MTRACTYDIDCCPQWSVATIPAAGYYNQIVSAGTTSSMPLVYSDFNLQLMSSYGLCWFNFAISGDPDCSTLASVDSSYNLNIVASVFTANSFLSCNINCRDDGWYPYYGTQTVPFTITTLNCALNTMYVPLVMGPYTINSFSTSATYAAFSDSISGTTSPPYCGIRTCTSDSPYVSWN